MIKDNVITFYFLFSEMRYKNQHCICIAISYVKMFSLLSFDY